MTDDKSDRKPPAVTLGSYLATIRADRKLTLRQVEEATSKEVSNAYLSQIENDKIKSPSPNVLHALAELYAIDYADLMERAGFISAATGGSGEKRHGRLATFSELNLSDDEQAALLEYLKFIRQRKK